MERNACAPNRPIERNAMASRLFAVTCVSLLLLDSVASAAIQRPLTLVREWEAIDTRFHTTADIDGDGNRELIVLSQSGRNVHVLRGDGSPRGYRVLGRIDVAANTRVSALDAIDADGDGRPELAIAWGGRISIVDGTSLQVRAGAQVAGFVTGFGIGDMDGDGSRELLVRRDSSMLLLSPTSLQTLGNVQIPSSSSTDVLHVGDVHGDARPEVVVSGGAYSISRAGQAWAATNVWTSPRGPMWYFSLFDVDGNGKSEAVTARYDGSVGIERISPASDYTPLAQYPIGYGIELEDLDGDGAPEALVSCGCAESDLRALTLQGAELWRMEQLHSGGVGVLRSASGELSLVFGHEWGLYVRPLPPAAGVLWAIGPGAGAVSSTFYDDGGHARMAILFRSSLILTGNYLSALDVWDGGLRDVGGSGTAWMPVPPPPQQVGAFSVVPVDRTDRQREVLALVGSYTADWVNGAPIEPRVWIMDGAASLIRERTVASSLSPLAAIRWRAASENQPRIAISGRVNSTSVRLQTIGLDDGTVAWQSDLLSLEDRYSVPLQAADLDADGSEELLAQVGSSLHVYSPGAGTAPVRSHADVIAASVLPAHLPSGPQLLLARTDGSVSIHDGLAATPSRQITLGYAAYSIAAFRDPESAEPLLAAVGTAMRVHQLSNGEQVAYHPYGGRMAVRDIDGDRRAEIVVTDNSHFVLRLGSAEIIHDNGFE